MFFAVVLFLFKNLLISIQSLWKKKEKNSLPWMIEMRETTREKKIVFQTWSHCLLQICEFPSLPKPKKLHTLECLLTKKKALKTLWHNNKNACISIEKTSIFNYPSILQKKKSSQNFASFSFFPPWCAQARIFLLSILFLFQM